MDYRERFRVRPGKGVKLADIDPGFKDRHESHEAAASESARYAIRLSSCISKPNVSMNWNSGIRMLW